VADRLRGREADVKKGDLLRHIKISGAGTKGFGERKAPPFVGGGKGRKKKELVAALYGNREGAQGTTGEKRANYSYKTLRREKVTRSVNIKPWGEEGGTINKAGLPALTKEETGGEIF